MHRRSSEPLPVPKCDPAKAHPDYRDGGPTSGYRNLREHNEGLRAKGQRALSRTEAMKAGWPADQIATWYGDAPQ